MSSRPAASFAPVPIENEAAAVVVHPVRYEKTFKGGFSTSICDLFQNPYERSSCCALTCCGTCLQDRNEYLLRGEMPPPWWIRLLVYGGGTVGLLILGIAVLGPLGLLVPAAFLTILGIRATQLRMKVRKEIIARLSDDETPLESDHFCAEHRRAHRICACIRNDVLYQQTSEPAQEPIDSDFCSSLWQLLAICCCGCCGCWWNALGMCATAQETRELRKLLPVEHFYIDYVTMQPYRTYYPAIEDLRRSQNGAFWSHLGALSRLSAKLIRILLLSLLILLVASTLHIVANFSIAKVIVVILTLGQAVVVLYLVHWRKHRFDLSLDAVIKLFASGFVFAMIVATLVEIVLEVAGAFLFDLVFAVEVAEDDPDYDPNNNDDAYNNQIFSQVAQDHLGTVLVFVFFQAFVVAALVEELTKYLCFWMVEHPDFVEPSAHIIETADSSDSMERQQEPSEATPAFRRREHQGIHSIASAITVGMVALAAGFACVENLLYVFAEGKSFSAGKLRGLLAA